MFLTLVEDVRYERSLVLVLGVTDEGILKQSRFTENEIKIIQDIALQKVHRPRSIKDCKAMEFRDIK